MRAGGSSWVRLETGWGVWGLVGWDGGWYGGLGAGEMGLGLVEGGGKVWGWWDGMGAGGMGLGL